MEGEGPRLTPAPRNVRKEDRHDRRGHPREGSDAGRPDPAFRRAFQRRRCRGSRRALRTRRRDGVPARAAHHRARRHRRPLEERARPPPTVHARTTPADPDLRRHRPHLDATERRRRRSRRRSSVAKPTAAGCECWTSPSSSAGRLQADPPHSADPSASPQEETVSCSERDLSQLLPIRGRTISRAVSSSGA